MIKMASSLAFVLGLMLMVRGAMGKKNANGNGNGNANGKGGNRQNCLNDVITLIEKQTALELKMEQKTATLEASIQELDNTLKTMQETVVFIAKTTDKTNYQAGDTYVFTDTVVNVGSGYNSSTGHFTAPIAGTYMFTIQFCNTQYRDGIVSLKVENEIILEAVHQGLNRGGSCAAFTGISIMQEGDEAWVDCPWTSELFVNDNMRSNVFSGVRL